MSRKLKKRSKVKQLAKAEQAAAPTKSGGRPKKHSSKRRDAWAQRALAGENASKIASSARVGSQVVVRALHDAGLVNAGSLRAPKWVRRSDSSSAASPPKRRAARTEDRIVVWRDANKRHVVIEPGSAASLQAIVSDLLAQGRPSRVYRPVTFKVSFD